MRRVSCAVIFLSALTPNAYAYLTELAMFSRANCFGFNESVSWDTIRTWKLETSSVQYNTVDGSYREFYDKSDSTWRSYAGCGFCGMDWEVYGFHYADGKYGDPDYRAQQDHLLVNVCTAGWSPSVADGSPCLETYTTSCNLTEW
ncbi:hypothetical protein NTD83_11300 [Pseudomonas protegens]|uniref:hypothetical protein n=1 Tax=Pseudomonas protegens TaxID=380021 RepID=UPI0021C74687|nr:hypothetical protein [Pseudomonas protegens]MCU1766127.1 hypothetical protein [Pseudomonas protegens]